MGKSLSLIIVVLLVGLSLPGSAYSQIQRKGWAFGFQVGAAQLRDKNFLSTLDSTTGGYVGFNLGWSFNPDFVLLGEAETTLSREDVKSSSPYVFTNFVGVVSEYAVLNNLYFRLGPRMSSTFASYKGFKTRYGFGMLMELGWDCWHQTDKALDIHLKALPQWYETEHGGFAYMLGGGLGFTWY